MKPLFVRYSVVWQFTNQLCGSVPQNKDLIDPWLRARMPASKPPEARELSEIQEEVFESLAAPEEEKTVASLGFQNSLDGEGKLSVRGATVRAHIKDCARQLSKYVVGKIKGETSFAVRVINTVYVEEDWVHIRKGAGFIMEPDGWIEKAFTVPSARGPVSAFKRFAYVEQPQIAFTLKVLGGAVSRNDLESIMQYGGLHGYGGERGMGHGRYIIEMIEELS